MLAMLKLDSGLNLGGACREFTPKNAESDEEIDVLAQSSHRSDLPYWTRVVAQGPSS